MNKSDISSPTKSTDSGIQLNMEQAAMTANETNLPSGWEKFEDEQGVYYWHKRTGTVTRERPELIIDSPSSTLSSSSSNDLCFEPHSLLYTTESNSSIKMMDEMTTEQHRFHVRSLGWTTIDEEDLTTERSSRSVNRCIIELTRGINDGIGRWGEGKDLYMDINNTDLLLIDPTEMTIIHKQSIPSIRVWGVGRENSRDFAYVAKDKDNSVRIYKCHVFRCDNTSARTIANTLHDTCRNLMSQRGLLSKPTEIVDDDDVSISQRSKTFPESIRKDEIFPSAMEEPTNNLPCTYLGCVYVDKPSGMDILRAAIEKVSKTVPEDKWLPIIVNISPSSFTITSKNDSNEQLLDCRIRYLSFLGVGQDPSFCGIITHCADNSFKCHVFHCLPSCVQLCKNIEAACKLRYQKCLDAHPQAARQVETTKSYGAQIKSYVESFWFGNKQSV